MTPTFSVLIPTIGREARLERCLWSVRCHQSELKNGEIEIIVASGSGVEDTWLRELCEKYGAKLVGNPRQDAASGKYVALYHSRGKYVVMLDSDNELAYWDTLSRAAELMDKNSFAILGIESHYLSNYYMSSLSRYLTVLLHISDPLSWCMAKQPRIVTSDEIVEVVKFAEYSKSWPLGANGFIFNREGLLECCREGRFEDSEVVLNYATRYNKRYWLRIPNRGVCHYVCDNLWHFIKKRRRQTYHYLNMQHKGNNVSWTKLGPAMSPWLAVVYCLSIVGPLWHTVLGIIKDKDFAWLWHMIACPASVFGSAWGFLTWILVDEQQRDLEGWLQPKQTT